MGSSVSFELMSKQASSGSKSVIDNQHLSYRPDIDGMRALAILAVVIYHAFPQFATGGFVGVDIFFVISGYLISSIIFKGVSANDFSLVDFYERRVRRIFPALLLVLFSTFITGAVVLMGGEYVTLSKHIIAGISFVQNLVMYTESGYFDATVETKPLMHLWSLGIEEQFYLLFPVSIIIFSKLGIRKLCAPALALACVCSFGFGLYYMSDMPAGVFFLPQFRVWELLFGSLLAYMTVFNAHHLRIFMTKPVCNSASLVGSGLLIAAVSLIDKNKQFPGYWALLPVLGSTLLIFSGPDAWVNKRILASRWLIFIGLISYPLYLWHWPIFSFCYIFLSGTPSVTLRVALVVSAVILAWLTYRFVELPLRRYISGRVAVKSLVWLAISFTGVAAITILQQGFPLRHDEKQQFADYFENSKPDWRYFKANDIPGKFRYDCDWYNMDAFIRGSASNTPVPNIAEKCFKSKSDKKIMFWGDSHAQQYIYGVTHELPRDIAILSVASSGCLPNLPDFDASAAEYCKKSNKFAIQAIKDQKPDVVIIAQVLWHDVSSSLPQLAAALTSYGVKHVIVMGPVPLWDGRLNQIVLQKYWGSTPIYLKDELVKNVLDSDILLKGKYGAGQGGFQYVSMIDLLCTDKGCRTYIGADRKTGMTTFDNSHLSPVASIYTAQTLLVPLIIKNIEEEE
ncbi:lipopolysaccharide modification acyltransferase [Pseudomonas fluorescens]|uniref:Lipopolysaccharide modification acyltransferase n=1 Tax=Pseudomonas fluorescens TaxID=294 RepID=A0A448DTH0_PSEFL|nr:acyltransferase family protein [Pseudomonas fluorescens]VEF10116.1 lipopolysaccharide modification acyltransferase [Pseudomonas fluorescens]